MATFDLARFRELVFGRRSLPDHPMGNVEKARKILALLPEDDPDYGIAELTYWTASLAATDSFTRGRRGRVLLELHEAARPLWRALGQRYLAPEGVPAADRDGDPAILRAMFDSASEFAAAFAVVLYDDEQKSSWVEEHLAALSVRMLRWLSRRLALAHMLHLGQSQAIWERLHYARNFADARGVFRTAVPAFEGSRHPSSPLAEYARALLLELVTPSALRPRDVELAYRIAARVGPARVVDASAGGLGLAIRRADAPWAVHGALLAIMVEPASDWFLGVLRRIYSVEDELRLGIQILAARPMTVTFRTETMARDHPWEEAMRFEASFQEHFQRGILLEPQGLPLAAADLLLPPGLASRGSQFSVPLDKGAQRIRVTRVLDESRHFQRARIEPLDA